MTPETTRALIRRLIHRVVTNTVDEGDEALVVDARDFLDPLRFEEEKRLFFRDTPQVVGFAGELAEAGSHLCVDVAGTPVVMTRARDGRLRAFVNACAHRGARVSSGAGKGTRLTCRFHGWSYALDGTLASRPDDGCFDVAAADCSLAPLAASDRAGLLVVAPHPGISQRSVDEHLADIEAELSGFHFERMLPLATRRYEVASNWKLVAALSYESYHFATLHRDSVAGLLHRHYVYDVFGRHTRWSFPLKGIESLAAVDEAAWPAAVPGAVSHALFPGTVLITNPEDAQIIRTEPGPNVGTSLVWYVGAYRDPTNRDGAMAAYEFGGRAFEDEDLPAAMESWQGLAARGGVFHVGRNEPVLARWCRAWSLRDGKPGAHENRAATAVSRP